MSGNDWDSKPIVPRIPKPRPPADVTECSGCRDDYPTTELREHAGWPLCGDCHATATTRTDRHLTRQLAYTA